MNEYGFDNKKVDFYNELIIKEEVIPQYLEENGEPKLSLSYSNEIDKLFNDQPELLDGISSYIQFCLIVASFAGFEPPSEFYSMMKSYVESEVKEDKKKG